MHGFSTEKALEAIRARRTEAEKQEFERLTVIGRGRINPDSPQERIARAAAMEKDISAQIEWLRDQPDSPLRTHRLHNAYDRLGELASDQGDHARAATISRSTDRRHHYQTIVAAMSAERCDCPEDLLVDRRNNTETRESSIIHYDTLVTPEGGTVQLMKCIRCGNLTKQ